MNSVSVIVICKNSASTLERSLNSILQQTYQPTEIIVLDGHSSDETLQLAEKFPVKISLQNGTGIAQARNQALALCHSKWIAFLDADDEWLPEKLEIQLALAHQKPQLELISCRLVKINPYQQQEDTQPAYTPSGFLCLASCFQTYGLFDTQWTYAADHAWFLLAKRKGLIYDVCPEILLKKHLHGKNLSLHQQAYRKEVFLLLKNYSD
jgi:glycosyltransferase involved in cell wall biosynthesis